MRNISVDTDLPFGEYTLKLIGMLDMPLLEPVTRSVSASISRRTSSKSTNFFPLQCRNSAYSVNQKTYCHVVSVATDKVRITNWIY